MQSNILKPTQQPNNYTQLSSRLINKKLNINSSPTPSAAAALFIQQDLGILQGDIAALKANYAKLEVDFKLQNEAMTQVLQENDILKSQRYLFLNQMNSVKENIIKEISN